MRRSGSVAGLAADPGLGLPAVIAAGAGIVVLDEAGGVALGAAGVPVLVGTGPVEPVARRQVLIGIEMVPALALDIPDDIEGLKAACPGGEKILLERRHAGDAGHLEGAHRAVRPLRLDEISAVAAEKARGDAVALENHVIEIAQHRRLAGLRPGPGVMRTGPCPRLARVAGGAGP